MIIATKSGLGFKLIPNYQELQGDVQKARGGEERKGLCETTAYSCFPAEKSGF